MLNAIELEEDDGFVAGGTHAGDRWGHGMCQLADKEPERQTAS